MRWPRASEVKGEPGRQASSLGFTLQAGRQKANSLFSGLHCNPRGRSCLPLTQENTMEGQEALCMFGMRSNYNHLSVISVRISPILTSVVLLVYLAPVFNCCWKWFRSSTRSHCTKQTPGPAAAGWAFTQCLEMPTKPTLT